LSHFSSSENPKEKWLTFKIFLKISLVKNFVMPPVFEVFLDQKIISKAVFSSDV